jgi:hypothetical protein
MVPGEARVPLYTAFVFEAINSLLNYCGQGEDPGWSLEAALADGTDMARRDTRLFNTHCAWQWTTTRLCTWRAWAGHTLVTLGPTLLPTTTRDATHHQTGEGQLPRMQTQTTRANLAHGVMSHAHELICTRAMGRGCVTRGDTAELAARPHNNNKAKWTMTRHLQPDRNGHLQPHNKVLLGSFKCCKQFHSASSWLGGESTDTP